MTTIIIYACLKCGRTINYQLPSTNFPNIHCWHNDALYIMTEVGKFEVKP